jgi:hypothetical protein
LKGRVLRKTTINDEHVCLQYPKCEDDLINASLITPEFDPIEASLKLTIKTRSLKQSHAQSLKRQDHNHEYAAQSDPRLRVYRTHGISAGV